MTDRRAADRRQWTVQSPSERRHGDRRTYQAGCTSGPDGTPCTPCRAANAAYISQLRQRHAMGKPILGALVPALETWRLLRQLKPECLPQTYGAIALLLGYGYPMLQFGRQRIRERTRRRVQRLCRERLALDSTL